MDIFKRKMNKDATAIDWNCPRFCKRSKGDTQMLHKLARHRLKQELKGEAKNERTS